MPEHPTDAQFSFTIVFKQALYLKYSNIPHIISAFILSL